MIYFVQEFDKRLEVSDARMVELYKRMADGWEKAWPSNRLIGFFSRRYGLGEDPQYMAIWEMPNFAAFDEWRGFWPQVKSFMQEIEDDFHGAIINERGRVMEKLIP
jgi:hypothetical protein